MFNPTITRQVDEKLSYLSVTCNAHFTYKSVGEQLFEMAEKHPDHVAFIFHKNDSLKLTYSDLKKRAVVLARNFEAIGLKKGERIALLLPNTYELVICYLAGALIGLVLVPLDQDYGSVELEFMIQKTKPSAIIVYNSEEFEPTVNDLFPDINSFEKGKYETEKFPGLKHVVFLKELNGSHRNVWTWEEINNDVTDNEIYEFPKIEPEEVDFAIMFTSGTTGTPKGVIKNQFKLVNNVQVSAQMSKSKAKIIKCFTPLAYHGVAMLSIIEQIFNENLCLVFPSKKLDLIDILESIETYKCNSIIAFPKILNNLLDHPNFHNYDLSSIESVACSGQLPPAELILKSKEMIPNAKNFTVVYGATELNKLLSNTLNLKDFNPETYQNCVGQLVPFAECKIVDPETGRLVPLNAEGELHVRTFSLTSGYYDDEEKTRTVIDKNKWYNTGDCFSMDPQGNFYFKSRRKELITAKGSGRLDIYPAEIEDCLLKHPNVREAIAFGVPINEYEQEICAWVKLINEDKQTTPNELIEFCLFDKDLADYKVPRFIKLVNEFPTTNMGKYLRRAMQDAYKNELGI